MKLTITLELSDGGKLFVTRHAFTSKNVSKLNFPIDDIKEVIGACYVNLVTGKDFYDKHKKRVKIQISEVAK